MRTEAWLNKKYLTLHPATGEPFADDVRAELMPLCDQEAAQAEYDDMKRLLLGNARHLNAENERLRELIGLAYGHLWMVNNEPGTPRRYPPERAAYEARKLLRDTMTHEQRGLFINRVLATVPGLGA